MIRPLPLCVLLLAGAAGAADLSPTERATLLRHFDRDKDGQLDDQEKSRAMGRADRNHDGQVGEQEVERLRKVARAIGIKEWWKAIGDQEATKQRSPQDRLWVKTTHSLPSGAGGYAAFVLLRWGDLDDALGKGDGGKERYSNWDGGLAVEPGSARVVEELAFDDAKGREPGVGRGADKLLRQGDARVVSWKAGVVGATDGLLIRLELAQPSGKVQLKTGGFDLTFDITPAKPGITLPNGTVTR